MASMNGLRSCSKTRLRPYLVPTCPSFLARLSARQARDDALARAMTNVLFARRPVRRVDRSEGTEPDNRVAIAKAGWR